MPDVEVVALEAKLPSAIDAEAKEKECDFVIYANGSHEKGSSGMCGKTLGKLSETAAGKLTAVPTQLVKSLILQL